MDLVEEVRHKKDLSTITGTTLCASQAAERELFSRAIKKLTTQPFVFNFQTCQEEAAVMVQIMKRKDLPLLTYFNKL